MVSILTSEIWHKGNNNPFLRSPMVDEQTIRPLHWLESVTALSFL